MEPFVFYPVQGQGGTDKLMTPAGRFDSQYCYAVFHEPHGHFMANHAVLFVYPWGQDYVRSHRALRKIALRLQQQGVASLRFDYRGTGDSGGDDCELSLESMIADVKAAYLYLKEHTGADSIQVIAARVGALVAVKALGHEVSEILCWDPILFGDAYMQELHGPTITSRVPLDTNTFINGYPLTEAFEAEVNKNAIEPQDFTASLRLYGVENCHRFKRWLEACQTQGKSVKTFNEVEPGQDLIWGKINVVGGFVNPGPLLQSIEERLVSGVQP